MIVVGIDPGLGGAIALYDRIAEELVSVEDMPTFETVRGRRLVDAYALAGMLRQTTPQLVVVELVASRPKQGVASSFNFGVSAGKVEGVCAGLMFPISYVTPMSWKKSVGIPAGSDKQVSRARASQLFGNDKFWPLKKHDGRAEAALLAKYGALFLDRKL